MRHLLVVLCMLLGTAAPANAQLNISFGIPGINIGISLGEYPDLVQVPDYPVYYAPRGNLNLFYYDGMYWAYQRDEWYASTWYNGPWGLVDRMVVPLYILRVPVRYYRNPPQYFRGWRQDAPPRWGQHWGNQWQERRRGWDHWDRKSAPRPAPLPVYQRQYSGDRYPRAEQQHELHSQNYRYQPREAVAREHYKQQAVQRAPEASQRREQGASQERSGGRQDSQRSNPTPSQQGAAPAPRPQPQQGAGQREQQSQRGAEEARRPAPAPAPQKGSADRDQGRQPQQGAGQREPQSPRANPEHNPQDKGASQDSRRRQEQDKDRQDKDREKGEGKGQERNR